MGEKKQMKKSVDGKRIWGIIELALFNFIFLGTEYMFDNMIAYTTNSKDVVLAQSYILGISVLGFVLYPVIRKILAKRAKEIGFFLISTISIVCIFVMQCHTSYGMTLTAGCIGFVLLGVVGSAVHYLLAVILPNDENLAKTVGIAYAVGLLLQFLNNNLVHNDTVEAIVLSVFWVIFILILLRLDDHEQIMVKEAKKTLKNPTIAGVILIVGVVLMTCIFATLDNAVTLIHAAGNVDIEQWPRLLLAVSGLIAGVLFDIKKRRYMNIIMYCVTLLSTICVLIIVSGGTFLIGLIVFYLSAGFFVVFFTTGFMELSSYMKVPQLWAGMGRAINNICAGIIGTASISLIQSGNSMFISMIALVLFALISVTMFLYAGQLEKEDYQEEKTEVQEENEKEKLWKFSKEFGLTVREQEVLQVLLTSDDSVQEIAEQLFISRAALYRHIAILNKKTETKSRIGLMQFYYAWKNKK